MRLLFFAAALAMAGCSSVAPTRDPPPQPAASEPAELTRIVTPGHLGHPPTRSVFPPVMGAFGRVSIFKRDPEGRRLTVGYAGGTAQCLTGITFFLDPAAPASVPTPQGLPGALVEAGDRARLAEAFKVSQQEVLQAHPTAQLEGDIELGMVEGMPAQRALYRVDDRRLELVQLMMDQAWYVKYWVIFPAHCAAEASPRITQFFEAWRAASR